MAKKKGNGAPAWSVEEILAQCFAAIGQGAGRAHISRDAVRVVRAAYKKRLEKRAADWNDIALVVLEYARTVGAIAAQRATAAGRTAIEGEDVEEALAKIESPDGDMTIQWPCPLC